MKIIFEKSIKTIFGIKIWKNYLHCELMFDNIGDNICWSAKEFEGVRFKNLDLSNFDIFHLPSISLKDELKCFAWCLNQCKNDIDCLCFNFISNCFQTNLGWVLKATSPFKLFKLLQNKKEIV